MIISQRRLSVITEVVKFNVSTTLNQIDLQDMNTLQSFSSLKREHRFFSINELSRVDRVNTGCDNPPSLSMKIPTASCLKTRPIIAASLPPFPLNKIITYRRRVQVPMNCVKTRPFFTNSYLMLEETKNLSNKSINIAYV